MTSAPSLRKRTRMSLPPGFASMWMSEAFCSAASTIILLTSCTSVLSCSIDWVSSRAASAVSAASLCVSSPMPTSMRLRTSAGATARVSP